jgi:hypothetical protein
MSQPINGVHAQPVLDTYRRAKQHVASSLYIALQHLEVARQTAKAHAMPFPMPESAPIQSSLDLVNKDLSNTENQP